jgi:hypothetical protein
MPARQPILFADFKLTAQKTSCIPLLGVFAFGASNRWLGLCGEYQEAYLSFPPKQGRSSSFEVIGQLRHARKLRHQQALNDR